MQITIIISDVYATVCHIIYIYISILIKATHALSPDLLMKKISMAKRTKNNLIF